MYNLMKTLINEHSILLMAEDDDDDFLISLDAFKELGLDKYIKRVKDGDDLMNYLLNKPPYNGNNAKPLPDVIFLDLNMPRKDGREALREIKSNPKLKKIPIVILTTSNSPDDIQSTYNAGANSFIQKPDSFEKFVELFRTVSDYWLHIVKLPKFS